MNKLILEAVNKNYTSLINFNDDNTSFQKQTTADKTEAEILFILEQQRLFNDIFRYGYIDSSIKPELKKLLDCAVYRKNDTFILKINKKWQLVPIIHGLIQIYGTDVNLNWIDISDMTDISWLFVANEDKPKKYDTWGYVEKIDETNDISNFNGDISEWDVSNIECMNYVFYKNTAFKGDISNWNVGKVTSMEGMFKLSTYSGDLSKWDVSSVTNMKSMFEESSIKTDLSKWDVGKVLDMSSMFKGCLHLLDNGIGNWNSKRCKNMEYMFFGAAMFNADLSNWNVSHVKNMKYMFAYTSYFNSNINNWKVTRVDNMDHMFYQSNLFNSPLDKWDVSGVETMNCMFYFARSFNHDISMWDVEFVESYINMFSQNFPEKYKPIKIQTKK